MSSARLYGVCICRVFAAVVCCVNSLNTYGAACLYTWQVHSPGSSPYSSIPPSPSDSPSTSVTRCVSFCFLHLLPLSLLVAVCLCVCLSDCLFLCVLSRCCSPVLQTKCHRTLRIFTVYYNLDLTFVVLATISTESVGTVITPHCIGIVFATCIYMPQHGFASFILTPLQLRG